MPKELKNIEITHISLVKAGANGKEVIYKTVAEGLGVATPKYDAAGALLAQGKSTPYEKIIKITKANEQGVVVGIVYTPNSEDSQGDFATAEEIRKAAYSFMKAARTANVDKDHDFNAKDAFVAESYIVQKGDPLFPNDEGAWAVAIQLESDELKEAVKKGEIAGLSMAGKAERTEVVKTNEDAKNLLNALTNAMREVWIEIRGSVSKSKQEVIKVGTEEVKAVLEPLVKELDGLKTQNETLNERLTGIEGELKKSKQNETVSKQDAEFGGKGVL